MKETTKQPEELINENKRLKTEVWILRIIASLAVFSLILDKILKK